MRIVKKRTLEDDIRDYRGWREEFDDSKFQRKSDQWLRNVSRFEDEEELTPTEKRNMRRTKTALIGSSAGTGTALGYAYGGKKGAAVGTVLGGALGTGISYAGDRHHRNEARKAKEELRRRGLLK